ncbi:hypothetical protein H1R20_g7421, partial [Candolleomyces eurysporus]
MTLADMTTADRCLSSSFLLNLEKILADIKGEDLSGFLKDVKLGEGELQREIENLNGAIKCQLDPCFGSQAHLNPPYKSMDNATIAMLWISFKELARLKNEDQKLTLDTIESTFDKNPFLERVCNRDVDSMNQPLSQRDPFLKFLDSGGSKEKGRLSSSNFVSNWFSDLIRNNEAVRKVTEISVEEIQKIVSGTGSNADSNLEKPFLDVGVLRFPDFEHPYIQVYYIQLTAWAEYRKPHLLGRKTRRSGVNGEYHLREYKLREKIIEGLTEEMRKIAIRDGERLIQDLKTPPP